MRPLDLFIPGMPKPKGSMRHVGNGRMVEQLAGSQPWRVTVAAAVYRHIRCTCGAPDCQALCDGYPLDGALAVVFVATFPKPKSAPKTRRVDPVTRSTGDIDKLARNILDALVDAHAIRDDAQVVELWALKRYGAVDTTPGVRIRVGRAPQPAQPADLSLDLSSAGRASNQKATT